MPDVRTPEEYGRYMIQQSGHFEYDENLEGFYDYRHYGEERLRLEGGTFNECGYTAYLGEGSLEEMVSGQRQEPSEMRAEGMQL